MKKSTILIIGTDDPPPQKFKRRLSEYSYHIVHASAASDIVELTQTRRPDLLIFYSTQYSNRDALKITKKLRQIGKNIPVILITKYSSESRAIAAIKAGVNDYLKFPVSFEDVIGSVKRLLLNSNSPHTLKGGLRSPYSHNGRRLIGQNKYIMELKSYISKVASADSTVLITGETGTGKELAAELIHHQSRRRNHPFICVNCAALPENLVESELFGYERGAFTGAYATKPGKFEMASGGTVFLDEIGDMNPYAQAKVLRSIESKELYHLGGNGTIPMDARVIAATNQDPLQLMAEGSFREDLYYRLNVARIHLPPLRQRKDDIPHIVDYALQNLNYKFDRQLEGLADETMASFYRYDWPGNVRELLNCLEAAFISLPQSDVQFIELPEHLQRQLQLAETKSTAERNLILAALVETKWNKSTAAEKLNWSRMTLYRKIEKYNIVEKRSPAR
jgi:DNA-binding NtrC family response regulator